MSDIEIFEIDDSFDPLATMFDEETPEERGDADYLPPIPDADQSVITEVAELTSQERIEALITGIPGQMFRILHAIDVCREPQRIEDAADKIDEAYKGNVSVYDATRLIELLEAAGALEVVSNDSGADQEAASDEESPVLAPADLDDEFGVMADEDDYLVIAPAPPKVYVATADGLEAYAKHVGEGYLLDLLQEEPRYLPLYKRILEMASADGGATREALDRAIDPDPLCEEPRRFCGYFLDKLEGVGAVSWHENWFTTALGNRACSLPEYTRLFTEAAE